MAKAKIYLYKEGNECTSLTGGWSVKFNEGTTSAQIVKYENYMKVNQTNWAAISSEKKIDIGKYSKLFTELNRAQNGTNSKISSNVRFTPLSGSWANVSSNIHINLKPCEPLDSQDYYRNNCEIPNTSDSFYVNFLSNATIDELYSVYLETKENVLTVNSQENDNITFSANDLGLVTISKIDVLVNGVVSKTYTDEYLNLSYIVDKSLCYIGNNNIEIRVTYSQGDDITETVSEYLTYKYDVSQLPQETPLLDTVERVKLLTKSKQNEKTMLSNILTSKNVEVTEEDKMSDLIGKVDLLGEYDDPILYLYKEGDECVGVTGGWADGFVYGSGTSLTKGDDYIETRVTVTSHTRREVRTVKTIDFTKYSKLCFYGDFKSRTDNDYKSQYFLISNSTNYSNGWGGGASSPLLKENLRLDGNLVHTIDISNINSISRLFWGVDSGSPVPNYSKVYKIWLEK